MTSLSQVHYKKVKWFLFVFFSLQNNFSVLGRVESERISGCYKVLWIRKLERGLSRDGGRLGQEPKGKGPCKSHIRDNGKLAALLEKGCQNPLLIPAKFSRV